MTSFETVRVAAIQATPVVLDAEVTVRKAADLLAEAAAQGARLAVLPEAFVSLSVSPGLPPNLTILAELAGSARPGRALQALPRPRCRLPPGPRRRPRCPRSG
jgi:predicted amidohydrolase